MGYFRCIPPGSGKAEFPVTSPYVNAPALRPCVNTPGLNPYVSRAWTKLSWPFGPSLKGARKFAGSSPNQGSVPEPMITPRYHVFR
jgi:hypothetical protein